MTIEQMLEICCLPSDAIGLMAVKFKITRSSLIFQQFTGLLDKNGKEIYEGDIVCFLDGEIISTENGMECDEFPSIGVVEWENEKQGWDITNRTDVDWIDCWDEVEVIGNIYENPDLLK